MKDELQKNVIVLTAFIWITFLIMVVIIHDGPATGRVETIIAMSLLTLALTMIMWRSAGIGFGSNHFESEAYSEKSKRTGGDLEAMMMVLELLDDNERAMLKRRLLNNMSNEDGELTGAGIYETTESNSHEGSI